MILFDKLYSAAALLRLAPDVALDIVAIKLPQLIKLAFQLNTLGDDLTPEHMPDRDNGVYKLAAFVALGHIVDKALVYLQQVDRQALEVAQRRIARAEVVKGYPLFAAEFR